MEFTPLQGSYFSVTSDTKTSLFSLLKRFIHNHSSGKILESHGNI